MPELPDLQVFSSNLRKIFKGKKLTRLNIVNGKRIKTSAAKFKKAFEKSIRDFLDIHNSHKQKSPSGAKIKHETVGGRKTYYTDEQTRVYFERPNHVIRFKQAIGNRRPN